jgi:hypothetical protein
MQNLLGNCPSVLAESAVDPSRSFKVVVEDNRSFRPSFTHRHAQPRFCVDEVLE